MNKNDEYYEQLDEYYSDPKTEVKTVGNPLIGEDAAKHGQALLVKEFGSAAAVEEFIRRGRPRLGQTAGSGSSREIRGRITDRQFQALQILMQKNQRTMSELIREMTESYLTSQK